MVPATDPVGGALYELDSLQEGVGNCEPFKAICRDHIETYDALREALGSDLEKKIVMSIFALFLLSIFYQISCVRMNSFPVFSDTFSSFVEISVIV